MSSRASSNASFLLKSLPPLPPSSLDIPDSMEGGDIQLPLMEENLPSAKPSWSADAADLFVLLCSFLLTTVSIVLTALVFHAQAHYWFIIPPQTLSVLQRVISSLSVAITSAVIMVAGKRYVLFKLARGGLRSSRVAVYSNSSIGNLASYLLLYGAEFPLLGLSAVWGLALATSLTVNDSWEMGSIPNWRSIAVPFGPFDQVTPGSSWLVAASGYLDFVTSSLCFGVADSVGLINITSANFPTAHPMGIVYYPPLPYSEQNIGFSFSTMLNGFNISLEQLSSVPSTAQNLSCVPNAFDSAIHLWFDGSDEQTLSIVATDFPYDSNTIFRINATAIIMGGTLSSTGNYREFALNGTSWPNVMPTDSQWAQDITSLICNTTVPPVGTCSGTSLSDFASTTNGNLESFVSVMDSSYTHWSTVLGMAIGAYSSAMSPHIGTQTDHVPVTIYGVDFRSHYGIYILILYIVVSFIMLIVVVTLRLASRLGPDFLNSTRLLMDPLKKPELFNASLKTTMDALEDPYMMVQDDSEFSLAERGSMRERKSQI